MVLLTSFPPPTEGVVHREEKTEAHVQGRMLGCGVLFVAESRLSWVGDNGQGFSLEYPAITIHAISRDLNTFPKECIYIMVDGDLGQGEEQNGTTVSSDEEDSTSKISEIRFIPEDKTSLDPIYKALTKCQELHPDENDSFSDEDNEDIGYFDNEDNELHLSAQGENTLQRMEAMFGNGDNVTDADQPVIGLQANGEDAPKVDTEPMDTEQFEDAD